MRIIAGALRRQHLKAPPGHFIRPSTDRVREALFGLVTHRVTLSRASVLDLFAGTGALGLEAISRGASRAVFVEANPLVLATTRRNARRLRVEEQCAFLRQDALTYLRRGETAQYNVVFADPPYTLEAMASLPELALPLVAPGGRFVLEHDRRITFASHPDLDCTRTYGRTIVSIFMPAAS